MRFLGIDPGLRVTGYGCIDAEGAEVSIVEAGIFRLGRAEAMSDGGCRMADGMAAIAAVASPKSEIRDPKSLAPIPHRLAELDHDFSALLARLAPDTVAVESLFAHPKHPATAILMAHARGVILLAVRKTGLPLIELRPAAVKRFLTGNGQAPKEQMQAAIRARLNLAEVPRPPDIADALAIALCASWRHTTG